ncbi:MAG TPA: RodZ domain-containing protein, partial [Anaerolineaceae bacterium]
MTETTGQKLLNARLARGETVEQASAATHIRPRYLQALEMDDWVSLPSTVQGKGFLRLYADYLGLDPQPLLAALDAPTPAPAPAAAGAPPGALPEAEVKILPAVPEEPPAAVVEEFLPVLPIEPDSERVAEESVPAALPARTSREIFAAIGKDLQRQRELLSLTLADVERHTRLRSFTLNAMEEGRMEDMPSFVQARGMLSNYAHFLNLDVDALLTRFAEGLQARRAELAVLEQAAKPQPRVSRRPAPRVVENLTLKRFLSVDLLATSFLVVLLIGFMIWGAGRVLSMRPGQGSTPTAPSVSDVLLASPQASQAGIAAGQVTAAPAASLEAAAEAPATETPTPDVQSSLPAAGASAIEINLVASQRAWIKVTADNKVVFTGRLVPGNAYPFSAGKLVEILTGNAAGFQVYFNNNDLGVVGSEGQVLDLIFTTQGMTKSAPAVPTSTTPTPTPTGKPTATR